MHTMCRMYVYIYMCMYNVSFMDHTNIYKHVLLWTYILPTGPRWHNLYRQSHSQFSSTHFIIVHGTKFSMFDATIVEFPSNFHMFIYFIQVYFMCKLENSWINFYRFMFMFIDIKFGNLFLFKFLTVMKPKSLETTWHMGHDGFMREILLALRNIVFLK